MHYAPEAAGNAPYVTGLAEYLASIGHRVCVLTGMPYYPQWRVHQKYRHRMWSRERLNDVTVQRRRQYVPRNPSAIRRAFSEASHYATAYSHGMRQADVVVGVVPTVADGLLTASIAKRSGIPYGLIFQDLVSIGASQSGIANNGVTLFIKSLERRMVSRASGIGIVATGFRQHIESLGVSSDRITRLRNWSRVQPTSIQDPADIRRGLGLPSQVTICLHAGNMGAKQGLENLVECARLAQVHSPDILFVLMGDGSQRTSLTQLAYRYRLKNIRFIDPQPDDIYANILKAADILIVNQRSTLIDMALPSKLTSYFAARRPVVAAVHDNSEAAIELEASGGGLVCAPESPVALLKALNELAADPEAREKLGVNGWSYRKDYLDPAKVLPHWGSFVEGLL
jgi:colanic acid biosynthesis glycosyl transferase WcaI